MSRVPKPQSIRRPGGAPDTGATPGPRPTAIPTTDLPRRSPRRSVGDLLWELKQLHNIAVRLEERIDDLYWDLHHRLVTSPASVANDSGRRHLGAKGTLRPNTMPVAWLESFVARHKPDGSMLVTINAKGPFALQPHLGALLLALAEDTGLSRDEGVAFKTLRDLSTRIAKHTGERPLSPDTINKYIHKLRKVLSRVGLGGDLIQVHRRLGRRLAVKRATG